MTRRRKRALITAHSPSPKRISGVNTRTTKKNMIKWMPKTVMVQNRYLTPMSSEFLSKLKVVLVTLAVSGNTYVSMMTYTTAAAMTTASSNVQKMANVPAVESRR